ncbi:MAG: general secretion pathway protein GspB [Gammaproteobacteria bacterium]|nr:general secretion pathway protein GspB [Gammaproteobacteria bacterium]
MSFILDALKKSETERQQQSSAEFSTVPTSSAKPNPFRWLWLIGALLAINLAVLIGILMQPAAPPAAVPAVIEATPELRPAAATAKRVPDNPPTFAEQVAQAQQNQLRVTDEIDVATSPEIMPPAPARPQATAPRIPTIDELLADGSVQLPELRIDIHVYSDVAAERFVFINMTKHREQSQLAEGPVVTEITKDGVILRHQGRTFLLPRE